MLKNVFTTTILLLVTSLFGASGQNWEKLQKESEGGITEDIAVVGDKIFMSHYSELFSSSDNGNTWQYVLTTKGLAVGYGVINYSYGTDKKILVSGDSLLFGNQLSPDGGKTWQTMTVDPSTLPTWYYSPTVFTFRGKNLYLGTYYNGFYQSSDFGKTFVAKNNGLTSWWGIYDTPDVIEFYNGQPVIATATGIFRWNGSSWINSTGTGLPTTVLNGFPNGYLTDRLRFVGNMWIASTNQGVYYTTNMGSTWQRFTDIPLISGVQPWPLYSAPAVFYNVDISGGFILASYENDVYVSGDTGATWKHVQFPNEVVCRRIVVSHNEFFAATSGGIYKSVDQGATWYKSNAGFERTSCVITKSGSEGFFNFWGSGLLKSTNHGENLIPFDKGLSLAQARVSGSDDTEAVATVTRFYAYGGVGRNYEYEFYKSSTQAPQWTPMTAPFKQILNFERTSAGAYLMTGITSSNQRGGLYFSEDNGGSWRDIFSGVTHNTIHEDIVTTTLTDQDTIYAGVAYSGIYKSWDKGLTWTPFTQGLRLPVDKNSYYDTTLVMEYNKLKKYKSHVYFLAENGLTSSSLYGSSDYGKHWAQIQLSNMPDAWTYRIRDYEVTPDGIIIASVSADSFAKSKLLISRDHGQSWEYFAPDFPEPLTSSFAIVGDYLYASGYKGLYRIPAPTMESVRVFAGSAHGAKGTKAVIPIRVSDFKEIVGSQFSVTWNSVVVSFQSVSDFAIAGMDGTNFGTANANSGILTFSWNDPMLVAHSLPDSTVLFNINFQLDGPYGASTPVRISDTPLEIEFIGKKFNEITFDAEDGLVTIDSLSLSGYVRYGNSAPLADTKVELAGPVTKTIKTNATGQYNFEIIPMSGSDNFAIYASEAPHLDPITGIDVADIAALRRHLLQTEKLQNKYSLLAADVNGSKSLSTLDIVLIDAMILGQITDWPPGKNWRFVPESTSSNVSSLFDCSETLSFNLSNSLPTLDFKGVKIGDVNLSLIGNPSSSGRESSEDEVIFDFHQETILSSGAEGLLINVPVRVRSFKEVSAWQFTLQWPQHMEFVNVVPLSSGIRTSARSNAMTVIWDDPSGKSSTLQDDTELFRISFKTMIGSHNDLTIRETSPVVYGRRLNSTPATVKWFTDEASPEISVFPNPASEKLSIYFSEKSSVAASIRIVDMTGRIVYLSEIQINPGTSNYELPLSNIETGVYALQIKMGAREIIRRVVKD